MNSPSFLERASDTTTRKNGRFLEPVRRIRMVNMTDFSLRRYEAALLLRYRNELKAFFLFFFFGAAAMGSPVIWPTIFSIRCISTNCLSRRSVSYTHLRAHE